MTEYYCPDDDYDIYLPRHVGNWRLMPQYCQVDDAGIFYAEWYRVVDDDDGEEIVTDTIGVATIHTWDHFNVVPRYAPPRAKRSIDRARDARHTRSVWDSPHQFEFLNDAIECATDYMRARDRGDVDV